MEVVLSADAEWILEPDSHRPTRCNRTEPNSTTDLPAGVQLRLVGVGRYESGHRLKKIDEDWLRRVFTTDFISDYWRHLGSFFGLVALSRAVWTELHYIAE
jgi:hypothetical protein